MGNIHARLQSGTDPDILGRQYPNATETELRSMALSTLDETLDEITEDERTAMYADARSLFCLKELASYLYDRVLMAFKLEASGQICSVNLVKDMLGGLNSILLSLKNIPPMVILESLFIFILQDRAGEQGFDINREMRKLHIKAEESLAVIREFNQQVPLTLILRCANRDMSLLPRPASGGEDWFIVYREYWKRHLEDLFADYMRDRRYRELMESFKYFLQGTGLKMLGNVESEANPNGLPIKDAFALSFLQTFYTVVFMADLNRVLRPILIDGDFHKKENRTEFAESYNELIKLDDEIKKFEANISPSGDFGKRYAQARSDMSSLPVKRRKIQLVLEDAEEISGKIISRITESITGMINILKGIQGKDPMGKYETLTNLSRLAGKGTAFVTGISDTVQKLQKTLQILKDIDTMESGR
jgi:hypothetical protein